MKVGYLGPKGTFTEEAAMRIALEKDLIPLSSTELIKALEKGEIQKAVLPYENSIEGVVGWVFDFLVNLDPKFVIEAEIVLPIKQNLVGFGKIEDIKTIYSNPVALAQCRKFIETLKVETKEVDSTSAAIKLIAQRRNLTEAAIGPQRAARIYDVPIIKEDIGDYHNNQTRFILLGTKKSQRTGNDKTTLVFGTENKPGALCTVLEVFKDAKINMTMIVSRPSKQKLGEYIFFVDIDGHQDDEKIQRALEEIKKRTTFLKILGSYPANYK